MTAKKRESVALTYVEGKLTVEPLLIEPDEKPSHPLAEGLGDFLQRLDDIVFAANTMVPASVDILNKRIKKAADSFDKAREIIQSGSASEASHAGAGIIEAGHQMERLHRSRLPEVIARSLFVNIFSEYDHFFGLLLRELYNRRPDILSSISKQISFDELLSYQSIDSVKEAILESEIDSIRRESYVDQFSALQKRFGIPLTKFQEWAAFIEAAQRRNLMVHCGGHVSEQYLQMCDAVNFDFPTRPNVGDRLNIDQDYFAQAAQVVALVGFMLTHTLWRKLLPAECSTANDELNDQLYKLLCTKRWKLVSDMGAFGLSNSILNGTSDIQHRIRLCNTAIALKNLDKPDEMKRLLSNVDWSASIRDFRLAVSILNNEFDRAAAIMKQIGKKGELVHEVAYHQWPLFLTFRERPEFQQAYEEIYGYPFYVKAEHTTEATRAQFGGESAYTPADTSVISSEKPANKKRNRKNTAPTKET